MSAMKKAEAEADERHLARQFDVIPSGVREAPINIVGAGAVGGYAALALAKTGFTNLAIFDPDNVEEANCGPQIYGKADLKKTKVQALNEILCRLLYHNPDDVFTFAKPWDPAVPLRGVIVSAADSMAVRRAVWEYAKANTMTVPLVIDSRMGAEIAQIYAYNPGDAAQVARYEKSLYADGDAVQEPCTRKATAYTAMLMGGMVAKTVKQYLCKQPIPHMVDWSIAEDKFFAFGAPMAVHRMAEAS